MEKKQKRGGNFVTSSIDTVEREVVKGCKRNLVCWM